MSHKVHPKGFRLGYLVGWDSRWFAKKELQKYLEEDFIIRTFLENKLKDGAVEKVEIERSAGKVNVIINTARPGLIIGRGGKGVEELKASLEKQLDKLSPVIVKKRDLKMEIREIRNPWINASLVSQWVAQRLEKRMPYRKVIKEGIAKAIGYKEAQGIKIEVSGRLNGVTISRREWLKKGRLPKQTLRADIDYGFAQAHCSYGIIGVKTWIYKGDKFIDKEENIKE
ncbi:MAG: 30S ribosomal protein S3 [Candidatus Paceibacterota bacterium]|jgi:small subunit ribosomal protein S3|nr:30S ribosomal protein S3 [Candidatus Paceibacterota bacterium]MDD5621066.1 30S ribosomal protein S3 [Candidatus Paceibacterota bacterium]